MMEVPYIPWEVVEKVVNNMNCQKDITACMMVNKMWHNISKGNSICYIFCLCLFRYSSYS